MPPSKSGIHCFDAAWLASTVTNIACASAWRGEVGGAHVLRFDSIELAVRLVTPRVHHVAARFEHRIVDEVQRGDHLCGRAPDLLRRRVDREVLHVPDEETRARLRLDAIQHREHSLLCERRQFVGTVGVPQMCPRPARRLDTAVHTEVERLVDRRPRQLTGAVEGASFACGVGRPEEHRRPVNARDHDGVGYGVPPDQGALVVGDRGFVCVGSRVRAFRRLPAR